MQRALSAHRTCPAEVFSSKEATGIPARECQKLPKTARNPAIRKGRGSGSDSLQQSRSPCSSLDHGHPWGRRSCKALLRPAVCARALFTRCCIGMRRRLSLASHLDIRIPSINTSPVTPPAPVHSSSPLDPVSLVSSLSSTGTSSDARSACFTTVTSSPVVGIIAHG
jgi:hypothetical protein